MKKVCLFLLVLLVSQSISAWNSTGHRIVAFIAYQHLMPATRQRVDSLTRLLFHSNYANTRFMQAAAWPDRLPQNDVNAFNDWHFIDLPYSPNDAPTQPPGKQNVVWAIYQSQQVIPSKRASDYSRAVFLYFLLHFSGDVHQPMHCAQLFSKRYPYGDKGGNLIPVRSPIADNLHKLWDRGLGLFYGSQGTLWRYRVLKKIAAKIIRHYPESYFKKSVHDLNAQRWAQESHKIAVNFAYQLQPNSSPSPQYLKQGRKIVEQRVALAGYRLANLLNQLYGDSNAY